MPLNPFNVLLLVMPLTNNEIAALVAAIKTLGVAPKASKSGKAKRKKKRSKKSGAAFSQVNPSPTTRQNIVGNEGQMTVTKDELVWTVVCNSAGSSAGYVDINPISGNFPWLKGVAKSWERIIWHSLSVSYRSMVSATTSGAIAYGADWTYKAGTDRESVTSLSPVSDHPVWNNTAKSLVLPANMLRSRLQYILDSGDAVDKGPGRVVFNVKGSTPGQNVGELWFRYKVTLLGPRKAE